MSLKWRIALTLALIAAVVSAVGAGFSYVSTSKQLTDNIDESLLAKSRDLIAFGTPRRPPGGFGGSGPSTALVCPPPGVLQPATAAQLVSSTEEVVPCLSGSVTLPVEAEDLAAVVGAPSPRTVSVEGSEIRVVTVPWPTGGFLQLGRDLSEVEQVRDGLRNRLLLIALGGTVAAAVLGWLLARRITRPVLHLRERAESIARTQDLATPIDTGGSGEIGSLARSFDTMVKALATSREQQQRLIHDASHEMRTPLTSMRTNLELLAQFEQLNAAQRSELVDAVLVDSGELTHILTELVELATDRSRLIDAPEPLRLRDVAADIVARAARRSGRAIVLVDDGDGRVVLGRPEMLERAVSNLVDNAVKYSPAPTTIEVVVTDGSVEVRDRGPGIAPEDQPFVFERFYRATNARTEPGSGLGLAIVDQIVRAHGGEPYVASRDGGGAVVGFTVPTVVDPETAPAGPGTGSGTGQLDGSYQRVPTPAASSSAAAGPHEPRS
jgi:two-component system sensor histidine kinase MprB